MVKILATLSSCHSLSSYHSSVLAFSKLALEEGFRAVLHVCTVGGTGDLGPILLPSTPSCTVDYDGYVVCVL